MNRREVHFRSRRKYHYKMRFTTILHQEGESHSEGPDDSRQAQKAQKGQKARRPG